MLYMRCYPEKSITRHANFSDVNSHEINFSQTVDKMREKVYELTINLSLRADKMNAPEFRNC